MMINDFKQLTRLALERPIAGNPDLFVVLEPFVVSFFNGENTINYMVPIGFETDLASVPKYVPKWIAQKVGKSLEAAVVHDHMCDNKSFTSEIAAHVFKAGLLARGLNSFKRGYIFRAVLHFGPQWGLHS